MSPGAPVVVQVLCDGATEIEFVRGVLAPHFAERMRLRTHLRNEFIGRLGRTHAQGAGQASWGNYRNAITELLRRHRGDREYVTTMIDLFRLKDDFPNVGANFKGPAKAREIERLCEREIGGPRFRCYIQCHEFEALVLADVEAIRSRAPESARDALGWGVLADAVESASAEQVNEDNGPSKRIIAAWPGYAKQKATVGPSAAAAIGLPRLRAACPHFASWIGWMESLAQ